MGFVTTPYVIPTLRRPFLKLAVVQIVFLPPVLAVKLHSLSKTNRFHTKTRSRKKAKEKAFDGTLSFSNEPSFLEYFIKHSVSGSQTQT